MELTDKFSSQTTAPQPLLCGDSVLSTRGPGRESVPEGTLPPLPMNLLQETTVLGRRETLHLSGQTKASPQGKHLTPWVPVEVSASVRAHTCVFTVDSSLQNLPQPVESYSVNLRPKGR